MSSQLADKPSMQAASRGFVWISRLITPILDEGNGGAQSPTFFARGAAPEVVMRMKIVRYFSLLCRKPFMICSVIGARLFSLRNLPCVSSEYSLPSNICNVITFYMTMVSSKK